MVQNGKFELTDIGCNKDKQNGRHKMCGEPHGIAEG